MEIVDYSKLDLSKDELDIIKDIFNENETVKCTDAINYCSRVLLLKDNKNIYGYCMYKTNEDSPYQGIYIDQIALYKKYQNKKLGRLFYNYLADTYKENIYAHVGITNRNFMKFHCNLGFYPISVEVDEDIKKEKNYTSLLLVKEIGK